jgi:hypothetical protein
MKPVKQEIHKYKEVDNQRMRLSCQRKWLKSTRSELNSSQGAYKVC